MVPKSYPESVRSGSKNTGKVPHFVSLRDYSPIRRKNTMIKHILGAFLVLLFCQCGTKKYNPEYTFDPSRTPAAPDYSQADYWAALPQKTDPADRLPKGLQAAPTDAAVDIFFLHPTTLLDNHKNGDVWNGSLQDQKLNDATDKSPILYQASAFNGAGKVYAPRYRQAHYWSFFSGDKTSAKQALDIAYADVAAAFDYYLKTYNHGRPFIIASHSQGARHAIQLIKEKIENTPLKQQLVVAYIAGWPVLKGEFKQLQPCTTPTETGCFCSWRTYERNYGLKHAAEDNVVVTNPVNWHSGDGHYAPKTENKGAVLKDFDKIFTGICDAEGYRGILLCTKPKFPGSILLRRKNYHIGDINLYYMDIRENAILRAQAFQTKK
jgi:hypothetical protein